MIKDKGLGVIRVSDKKNLIHGDSPENQRENILLLAEELMVTIPKTHWEEFPAESGAGNKKHLDKIYQRCVDDPQIKYVLINMSGRLTRGGVEMVLNFRTELMKIGVEVRDTEGVYEGKIRNMVESLGFDENEYDWAIIDEARPKIVQKAEEDKNERDKILRRTIPKEMKYMRQGYSVNPALDGYKNVRERTPNGIRAIRRRDPERARFPETVFEMSCRGFSDPEIRDELNRMGYRSKKFFRYDKNGKVIGTGGKNPMTTKQVDRIRSNTGYAGISVHKFNHHVPVRYYGDALVSIETWNKANQGRHTLVVDGEDIHIFHGKVPRRYAVKRRFNPDMPYKGILMCDKCSWQLKASNPTTGSGKRSSGRYHCYRKKAEDPQNHDYYEYSDEEINNIVRRFVAEVEFSEEHTKALKEKVGVELEQEREGAHDKAIALQQKVTELGIKREEIKKKIPYLEGELLTEMNNDFNEVSKELALAKAQRDEEEQKEFDAEFYLARLTYYMEHLEELILDPTKPRRSHDMFAIMFEERPTVQNLVNGTAQLHEIFRLKPNGTFAKASENVPVGDPTPTATELRTQRSGEII